MSHNKIIMTACIGIGAGAISGISWILLTDRRKIGKGDTSDTIDTSDTGDTGSNLMKVDKLSCKCPMANLLGVSITGGVLSGALTWFYYSK